VFAALLRKWSERDVRSITRAECEDAITDAGKRGIHAAASMYMVLRAFFGWLEKRDLIVKSPMRAVEKVAAESSRERVLTDDEIKAVWRGSAKVPVFGDLVRLLLLTGQRRTECAAMKHSDIDLKEKLWRIAGAETKNRAPHVVPLSDEAIAIIKRQPRFEECDFVFTTDGATHFKGYSKCKAVLDKIAPTEQAWTLHDLRRTLATRLAKAGVSLVVAEKILNHGRGVLSGVAGTYNRHEYLEERRTALDNWAATVERIANGRVTPSPQLVPA
jgi:integrase